MNDMDRKVIGVMRQDYDLCDGALQARIDAECDRYLASVGAPERFSKDASAYEKIEVRSLRKRRIVISYNDDEYAQILAAVDPGRPLAAEIRELSLKAAVETLAAKRRG